jgi:hypothetical protein
MVAIEPETAATRPINSTPDRAGACEFCVVEASMITPAQHVFAFLAGPPRRRLEYHKGISAQLMEPLRVPPRGIMFN